jgi:hypothetical protein
MTRLTLLFLAGALALLAPAAALAKGASEATITGPGLERPITLAGESQPGGEQLMQLAEHAEFFFAVFAQTPSPMLDERPAGRLGPRYTIEYTMPGPNNEEDVIVQELYPYATPEPVTYTEPGQKFWTTEETVGGWYLPGTLFRDELVALGLPESPPGTIPDNEGVPWTAILVVAVVAAFGALAAFVLRSRRRARPAPA